MTIRRHIGGFALICSLLLPSAGYAALQLPTSESPVPSGSDLISRGGGRGGGAGRAGGGAIRAGGGGGAGGRSGSHRGGGDRLRGQTGFQGAASGLNRGDRRPSGGWSSGVRSAGARPSLDRPGNGNRDLGRLPTRDSSAGLNRPLNRPGDRELNRTALNRDGNRAGIRDVSRSVNTNWNRTVNIADVDLHPGWARPGWGVARPWNYGWYGAWSNPPWGWWGVRAATWGIGTLATASLINNAVDAAINDQVSYIVVPETSYQLLYGSVQPSGTASVSFAVTADGSTYELTADCQAGTLNGQEPATSAEAELLNAACQVAYGST